MDVTFWESVADTYDTEIFSVLACDRVGAVLSCIDALASPEHTAADLGCGVGKWLPHLAERFASVFAMDHSEKLLEYAKTDTNAYDNITFVSADLTKPNYRFGKFDFILCVNVAIMPGGEERWALLNNVARSVRADGHLLLVVPSLESALYVKQRYAEMQLKEHQDEKQAWSAPGDKCFKSLMDLQRGIVEIEHVRTKHYLREELLTTLEALHLTTLRLGKVEYQWDTEFSDPPRWLKEPYPWDWMALARK